MNLDTVLADLYDLQAQVIDLARSEADPALRLRWAALAGSNAARIARLVQLQRAANPATGLDQALAQVLDELGEQWQIQL